MSLEAHSGKFSTLDHKRVKRLLMYVWKCLVVSIQAERTIAIRKRKFLNKFSVIHNALCRVFVANAKTELESRCTDV